MLTVVIPTIGREQLFNTILKIQDEFSSEYVHVIIVAESNSVYSELQAKLHEKENVTVIKNPRKGVSSGLNEGLRQWNKTTWLSIFSDDDEWLEGRRILLEGLTSSTFNSKVVLVGSCEKVSGESGKRSVRIPKIQLNESPTDYVYGGFLHILQRRYLSLTSMLISPGIEFPCFRENLSSREDIAWLEELFKKGFVFKALPCSKLARIQAGYKRTIERDNALEVLKWIEFLRQMNLEPEIQKFLWWHYPKSFVAKGNPKKLIENYPLLKQFYHSRLVIRSSVIAFQVSLAFFSRMVINLQR
jgi:hypothetical protein